MNTLGYATRSKSKPVQKRKTLVNPILFVYPSDGNVDPTRSIIEFTRRDLNLIRSPHHLNDTIISFFMQFHLDNHVEPELRSKIHVFNNFFYSKIKSLKAKQDQNSTATGDTFRCASKWVKGVEIFNKDFLIMPICEKEHWYLVIICYPSKQGNGKKASLTLDKDLYEPAVIVLNSSINNHAPKVKKALNQFLCHQWKTERGTERTFAIHNAKKNGIRLLFADVPQQRNNYNCGVFILNYFYCFLRNPREAYLRMFRRQDMRNWFEENGINMSKERNRMADVLGKQVKHWQDLEGKVSHVKKESQEVIIDSPDQNDCSMEISEIKEVGPANNVIVIH